MHALSVGNMLIVSVCDWRFGPCSDGSMLKDPLKQASDRRGWWAGCSVVQWYIVAKACGDRPPNLL